jgi:hypothetical protein
MYDYEQLELKVPVTLKPSGTVILQPYQALKDNMPLSTVILLCDICRYIEDLSVGYFKSGYLGAGYSVTD